MTIQCGEELTRILRHNLQHRKRDSTLDLHAETEALLHSIGASATESGGRLSFYGKDPIVPYVVPFGSMAAVALAAKAVQIAAIWRMRTGIRQDISVDVRKARHRYGGFLERKWEKINGYVGGAYSEPDNPLEASAFRTKDGRWVLPSAMYPKLYNRTCELLDAPGTHDAIARAVGNWKGEELERAGAEAGLAIALARPLQTVLGMDVYRHELSTFPLIEVKKIADSPPKPFSVDAESPLEGIRALGLAHVIAGPATGRSLALHGADVLNVWNPQDWEHDIVFNTAHVGMRSAWLRLADEAGRAKFEELLGSADVFFSNRRPQYVEKYGLGPERLCRDYPGLIHARVIYAGENGPWSNRVGFDLSTAYALGLGCLQGSDDSPIVLPVAINDNVAGWLLSIGILQALKRRAVEGGSYTVKASLSRTTLWLMSLGIFDKAYAAHAANSSDAHADVAPDLFTADTPLGHYTGMTEQVEMSATPGRYARVLEPRGSSMPEWLPRVRRPTPSDVPSLVPAGPESD